jgi:hypothetical protein
MANPAMAAKPLRAIWLIKALKRAGIAILE